MHQFLLDQISDKINFWFTLVHCNYQLELISMEAQHDDLYKISISQGSYLASMLKLLSCIGCKLGSNIIYD